MKITYDKTENSQAYLTIEVEPAEVEESLETAFKRLVKKTRIPGFRKGKAPRHIFERYMGKEALMEEGLNDLLPVAYEQAIKEHSLESIAQPDMEIDQMDPLILKATVPLRPTVELGDYKSLRVKMDSTDVADEKIDAVVDQLRHQYATWEPVEGRTVEFKDMLVMDIVGTMGETSVLEQKAAQYVVTEGQTFPVDGFPEQLIGMNTGDEKEFELEYPEDHPDTELAGNKVKFVINAIEIKAEVLPEADDEFAKTVGAEFENMKALRDRASSDMKERAEQQAKAKFEEEVIHSLADISKVEYPPIMVESETNRILNQQFQNNAQNLEKYLSSANKTEEELREELKSSAEHKVLHSLVLGKVSEEEKIEATEEEITVEIERISGDSGEKQEDFKKYLNDPNVRESIARNIVIKKTIEKLTEYAAVSADEPEKVESKPAKKTTKKKASAGTEEAKGEKETEKPKTTRTRKKKKEDETE